MGRGFSLVDAFNSIFDITIAMSKARICNDLMTDSVISYFIKPAKQKIKNKQTNNFKNEICDNTVRQENESETAENISCKKNGH